MSGYWSKPASIHYQMLFSYLLRFLCIIRLHMVVSHSYWTTKYTNSWQIFFICMCATPKPRPSLFCHQQVEQRMVKTKQCYGTIFSPSNQWNFNTYYSTKTCIWKPCEDKLNLCIYLWTPSPLRWLCCPLRRSCLKTRQDESTGFKHLVNGTSPIRIKISAKAQITRKNRSSVDQQTQCISNTICLKTSPMNSN